MFNSLDDDIDSNYVDPDEYNRSNLFRNDSLSERLDLSNQQDLDEKRGRKWMCLLGVVGIGGLTICIFSILTVTVFSGFYDVTTELLFLLEEKTKNNPDFLPLRSIFSTVVLLPLFTGLIVVIVVCLTSYIAYKRSKTLLGPRSVRSGSASPAMFKTMDQLRYAEGRALCCSYKTWFLSGYIMLVVLILCQFTAFVVTLVALGRLSQAVELSASGISAASPFETDIANLQYASFNQCCEERGFSNQGKVDRCDSFGDVENCTIADSEFVKFSSQLCVCHTSSLEDYDADIFRIQGSSICELLERSVVGINDNDVIPGSSFKIKSIVPASETRVVGYPNEGRFNPNPFAPKPDGYGCGRGYARGFQYFMFQFIFNSSVYFASTGIIVTAIQLGVLAYMAFVMFNNLLDGEDDDFMDGNPGDHVVLTTYALNAGNQQYGSSPPPPTQDIVQPQRKPKPSF